MLLLQLRVFRFALMMRVNISEVIFSSVFHLHNSERSRRTLALFALREHRAHLFCTVKQLRKRFIKYSVVKLSLQDQCWTVGRFQFLATLHYVHGPKKHFPHTRAPKQKNVCLWRFLWVLDHHGLQATTINMVCSPGKTGLKCFLNGPLLIQQWPHSLSMI